ncbi:MAG: methyltransferase family protein, partial [Thermodesulfobacteriota bacterium]
MRNLAIPPVYLLVAIITMLWMNYIFPLFDIFEGNIRYMGFLLITLGTITIILAAKLFHRADTPLRVFEKPKNLVTGGIYRFTRNPIYMGMVIILTGLGVFLGGLTPFFVIPIFIWTIQT